MCLRETLRYSETLSTYESTRRHNPEKQHCLLSCSLYCTGHLCKIICILWQSRDLKSLAPSAGDVQSAFHEKVPGVGGGGSGAVRRESLQVGGLKGCYWWKAVWRTRELHYYIQTENISQLRVVCSECTCTVYCGCCDNVLQWITLNSSEHMKDFYLLFVQWLWNKYFQDG
jgi:hypothetical protein